MQTTSATWKWLCTEGGKTLPPATYTGDLVSFDNPGYTWPKNVTIGIKPVQAGSGDPSPTNVRPINGWTGANVTRTGKNLTDMPFDGYYDTNTGAFVSNSGWKASRIVRVEPNSAYTLTKPISASGAYCEYDGSMNFIGFNTLSSSKGVQFFTTRANAQYFAFYGRAGDYQLEHSSSASAYEAYQGQIIPISWQSVAGTVYGGTLDVTTGVLTVTMAEVDLGTLNWSMPDNSMFRVATPTNMKTSYFPNWLCSKYVVAEAYNYVQWAAVDKKIGFLSTYNYIICRDTAYSDLQSFKTAMSGVQLVYELATPQTYQLTPTEVTLLLGENNVWADTGDITVALESPQGLHLETKAIISGTDYTDINSLVINRAVMQGGLSIGNAVSANCSFMIRTNDPIPKSAPVQIKMRLASDTSVSEWLPAGTFYISHRSRDPITGVLSVEGYDALLKGNAVLSEVPWTTGTGAVMTTGTGEWIYFRDVWPRKMSDLLNDILMLLDVELDARTQINTGGAYVLERPEGEATVNSLLGRIAAAHGGSFIITPEGKLRLVPVVSAAGATPQTAVPVAGVLNRMALGGGGTVTGIRYRAGEEDRVVGDESGIVIDADVSAALAAAVYSQLNGVTYQAYELSGALYDPAVELGDYIRAGVNDDVLSVLYSETATYGPMLRGDIGAPEPGELSDEYPYIGQSAKALSAAKVYADKASRAAAQALDNTLTQQEIFDRLTDGGLEQGLALEATMPSLGAAGEKKLYLNLDYARFGKLVADFIQGGTLTLGGLNNADGVLQVLDAAGNVIGTFDNSGVDITDGSFTTYSQDRLYRAFLDVGKLTFQYYGVDPGTGEMEWIDGVSLEMKDNSTAYLHARNRLNVSGSSGIDLFTYKASTQRSEITLEDNEITLFAKDTVGYTTITLDGNSIIMDPDGGGVSAELNGAGFFVTGTKSRLVRTDQYGDRLLYCYETPSPMFGDVGEGVIGGDGLCYVALDAVFAQTIGDGAYQVFLQKYGAGDCQVKERRGGCFIVEGTPGMAFGWEIKAKQRDYEQRRLDRNDGRFSVPAQQYGAEAAQYIEELMNGRVLA